LQPFAYLWSGQDAREGYLGRTASQALEEIPFQGWNAVLYQVLILLDLDVLHLL
jgi:hypothetical protein